MDRRQDTELVAERVTLKYEESEGRKPLVVGRSRGPRERAAVEEALNCRHHDTSIAWSFDILSVATEERRFIEIKGRGTSGPIAGVLDREYNTAFRLGSDAWLYVVFGCSEDRQCLYVASDWARLPWEREREPNQRMFEDRTFGGLLLDKRSLRKRQLDAEGRWQLPLDAVHCAMDLVEGGPSRPTGMP